MVSFGLHRSFYTTSRYSTVDKHRGRFVTCPYEYRQARRRRILTRWCPCQGICWRLINRGNTVPIPRRLHLLIVVLIVVIVLPVVIMPTESAVAPVSCPSLPESDALARDAQHYAKDFGVDVEEAICRLSLQDEIGELGAELAANERDTFAGLRIQHQPDFRVIVEFTSGGEETMARYLKNSRLANIVEIRNADVSLENLKATQREAMRIAEATGMRVESSTMVQENRVELYVTDSKRFWAALRDRHLRLPHNVSVIEVEHLSEPD